MDRNGLRPMRYTRTADGLLVVGSETGMVPLVEGDIVEKGRVGPGEMVGVDLEAGRFYRDRELKDLLAGQKPFGAVGQEHHPSRQPGGQAAVRAHSARTRRSCAGARTCSAISVEELELLLAPMVQDGKEAVGSMGDDTPMAVLSRPLPRAAPLLPAAVQPGHQPADRPACANTG